MKLIAALARTFGIHRGFFFDEFDENQAGLLHEQVELLALVRNAQACWLAFVRLWAMRPAESSESVAPRMAGLAGTGHPGMAGARRAERPPAPGHLIGPGAWRPALRRVQRVRRGAGPVTVAARPGSRSLSQPYQTAAQRDCAGPAERSDERVARLVGGEELGDVVVECR